MVRKLLLILFIALVATLELSAQATLRGTVTDEAKGETLIGTYVTVKSGGKATTVVTDLDGNYNINLEPGKYQVEATYLGYAKSQINDVLVKAGQANVLDIKLSNDDKVLNTVVISIYKVPLIEQDKTTSGGVLTSEQIRTSPLRDINSLAANTAGLSAIDGGSVTIKGSRSDATAYILDGIRVRGALPPSLEIEQLQVITGGIEAQYGDVTGGIISVTSKGPASKFSGALEAETSKYLDPYGQSLFNLNLSGPIIRNKNKTESILGFRISAQYTEQEDDNPRAFGAYRVKDAKLKELEAKPIRLLGNTPLAAAEYTRNEDVELVKTRPFEGRTRLDLTGKLDARLTKNIDLTLSGNLNRQVNQFTPANWAMLNTARNPFNYDNRFRVNLRLRHRLSGNTATSTTDAADAKSKRGALIRNAYYTLQGSYEKGYDNTEDQIHKDRLFDYGYIGEFNYQWIPVYGQTTWSGGKEVFGQLFGHTGYEQVFTGYKPGTQNPIRANYNNSIDVGASTDQRFLARNSFLANTVDRVWGLKNYSNVGDVYNRFSKGESNAYTFQATAGFDLLLGGSEKGRHSIQLGLLYEQRDERSYVLQPESLWEVARLFANKHLGGLDTNKIIGYNNVQIPFTGQTVDSVAQLANLVTNDVDLSFYKEVRKITGNAIDEYTNIDALRPDQLKLSMFAPRELMDRNIISYYGYDYLGNRADGKVDFNSFFTARNAAGRRTFIVAPNRPIYQALFLQDKFTYKDIIFRIGVRADVYDANTKVMKDPYSLYAVQSAGDFYKANGGQKPGAIGDDYKVYVGDDGSKTVKAFRNGDQWFFPTGTAANDGNVIFGGGVVYPKLVNDKTRVQLPNFDPNTSFQDYTPQLNIMPRLAFSFPISEEANFFAHYDILAQRPPDNNFATAADYFYFYEPGRITEANPISNPNLKPERTVDYEVGFQQKLTNSSALKVAAYYKEMRDMIQRRTYLYVPILGQYDTYGNVDFGTVKGFTLQYDLRRTGNATFNLAYTLQFADGTGSDANAQRGLNSRGNLRTLFPLTYDERHRIVATLDYRYGRDKQYDGPRVGGVRIFEELGLNLQLTTVSGRPYTSKALPLQSRAIDVGDGVGTVGGINGSRLPWTISVDMRIDKTIAITKKLEANIFVRVQNLLDTRNTIGTYAVTGTPKDDGYLSSSLSVDNLSNIRASGRDATAFLQSYQRALLDPGKFTLPRRIYAGFTFNF